jgi:hypothetical protein
VTGRAGAAANTVDHAIANAAIPPVNDVARRLMTSSDPLRVRMLTR